MAQRTYKAIFFDLDGTLLPVDMDGFLKAYFKSMAAYSASFGYDPEQFVTALNKGVRAMILEEGGKNVDRFWNTFCQLMGGDKSIYEEVMDGFYGTVYDQLEDTIAAVPESAQIVKALKAKGYPLYLTTMPLFPRIAVTKRLSWAGCDPNDFDRITTYDNSTSTKPKLSYYRENVAAIGLDPTDILMVGNNVREDMCAMELGMDGFLVTDWLLNPDDKDINQYRHGTLKDLLEFVCALPACEGSVANGQAGEASGEGAAADPQGESVTASQQATNQEGGR